MTKFGSLSSEDHDFDPSAEMLVHDYDDERTLEEEEMMEESKNFSSEIEDLEKEGNMPLEDLLAFYGYEPTIPVMPGSSANSSPSELADELPDMTLDKEEIAKDLLSGDDEETQSSADDLTPSVTSHEATDFFPRPLRSNTTYDGDKESDGEDVEADNGNSSEDLRKEIMVGSQYQAEIPAYLGRCSDDEKAYENEDHLLWKPDVISESKVKEYLFETSLRTGNEKMIGRIPEGLHTRDNEQALYELLKSSHNVKEAIERYCLNGKASQGKRIHGFSEKCGLKKKGCGQTPKRRVTHGDAVAQHLLPDAQSVPSSPWPLPGSCPQFTPCPCWSVYGISLWPGRVSSPGHAPPASWAPDHCRARDTEMSWI
uniref:ELM2 domain-containing protein n=1 Tax=Cyanoderma ruficeps TaxID=181631 RepID=A0A8C3QVP3_9PASS